MLDIVRKINQKKLLLRQLLIFNISYLCNYNYLQLQQKSIVIMEILIFYFYIKKK